MNFRDNEALREKLAAEYVLGTLKGRARRRFDSWLHQDAALRRSVAEWQERLAPMLAFARAEQPPASAWRGIERRLKLAPPPPAWQFWRRPSAGFWQPLGLAASACALVLAVLLSMRAAPPAIEQLATLTDDHANTALVVTADRRAGSIVVRVADNVSVPSGKTLQLWAIPKSGAPRSLLVLNEQRHVRLPLTEKAIGADVAMLAISLEPAGGSPNPNGPTGPVLYKGAWVRLM